MTSGGGGGRLDFSRAVFCFMCVRAAARGRTTNRRNA